MEPLADHGELSLLEAFVARWRDPGVTWMEAHTSGSTGAPKAIRLPKELMLRSARRSIAFFGLDSSSLLVCPLSMRYIAAKMMAVRAATAGCRLQLLSPSNSPFAALQPPASVDLLAIVPSQVEALATWPGAAAVRHVIIGGAPLTAAQEAQARSLPCANVWATYGMTETASHVALRDIKRGADWFEALPGVELGLDGRGCLVIDGLPTNDMAELLPASPTGTARFRWLGRADNVVNSGGVKLHPEVLEAVIEGADPRLAGHFYFAGRPSEQWGTELVAVADSPTLISPLRRACEAALSHQQRPKAYLTGPRLLTPNGKLLRRPPQG